MKPLPQGTSATGFRWIQIQVEGNEYEHEQYTEAVREYAIKLARKRGLVISWHQEEEESHVG